MTSRFVWNVWKKGVLQVPCSHAPVPMLPNTTMTWQQLDLSRSHQPKPCHLSSPHGLPAAVSLNADIIQEWIPETQHCFQLNRKGGKRRSQQGVLQPGCNHVVEDLGLTSHASENMEGSLLWRPNAQTTSYTWKLNLRNIQAPHYRRSKAVLNKVVTNEVGRCWCCRL